MVQAAKADPLTGLGSFGQALRYARKRARLTQRELAIAVGYSEAQISYLEHDQRLPDVQTVAALFLPVLELHDAPELAARLIELAAAARSESAAGTRVAVTHTVKRHAATSEGDTSRSAQRSRMRHLPAVLTSLVGREDVLVAIRRHLLDSAHRLLTLTGPPGMGKTSLAVQTAHDLAAAFADGVAFAALAPLGDARLVTSAVAQVLEVPEEGELPLETTVQNTLRDKHLLLVLDNFEHVMASAPLVTSLLAAPHVRILVTSREPLRLAGEQEYAIPPRALPDPNFQLPVSTPQRPTPNAQPPTPNPQPPTPSPQPPPAIQLFVARAQAVRPTFELTTENAAAVAQLCVRLDGVPLAIELAAARIKVLTPQGMLARLGAPLDFLNAGARRDAPAHQRTLRDAIAWSYNLLDADEQTLYRQLAVFAGGWTLEAAEAIAVTESMLVLDGLASLVDKNLVRQFEIGDEPRFTMLEMIREYARERLVAQAEVAAVNDRHVRYYVALAETAETALEGVAQKMWLDRLELEHDNLRAALAWVITNQDVQLALRLAGALGLFWFVHNHLAEGRRQLEIVLALPGVEHYPVLHAKALNAAARLAWMQDDPHTAQQLAEQSLALWRTQQDAQGIARALVTLGDVVRKAEADLEARVYYVEAIELLRSLGDRWALAQALRSLGSTYMGVDAVAAARPFCEESLALRRAVDDTWGVADSLDVLSSILLDLGELDQAQAMAAESLALRHALNDRRGVGYILSRLGLICTARHDMTGGTRYLSEALAIWQEIGNRRGVAIVLNQLGELARLAGDLEQARDYYERSLVIFQERHSSGGIATVQGNLAFLALRQGRVRDAITLFSDALDLWRVRETWGSLASCLIGLAASVLALGDTVGAVQVMAAAQHLAEVTQSHIDPADWHEFELARDVAYTQVDAATFNAAWTAGEAMTLDEALVVIGRHMVQ